VLIDLVTHREDAEPPAALGEDAPPERVVHSCGQTVEPLGVRKVKAVGCVKDTKHVFEHGVILRTRGSVYGRKRRPKFCGNKTRGSQMVC